MKFSTFFRYFLGTYVWANNFLWKIHSNIIKIGIYAQNIMENPKKTKKVDSGQLLFFPVSKIGGSYWQSLLIEFMGIIYGKTEIKDFF